VTNDLGALPAISSRDEHALTAVSAGQFDFDQLADIYNSGRVDYIVPMPMNGRRMAEYIHAFDVDLKASVIAMNALNEPAGLGMLGLRDQRAWITRLGVVPERRGRHIGQFMMERLLETAANRRAKHAQLEVIEGNEPAIRLFLKLGFQRTRVLLVLRRPPGAIAEDTAAVLAGAVVHPLTPQESVNCLTYRDLPVSWLEESVSMQRIGMLEGLRVTLADGVSGSVVYCKTALQLSHMTLIVPAHAPESLGVALLAAAHQRHPRHDTKFENLDVTSRLYPAYRHLGYVESFRRIEMRLKL
jgi:ribosomal protein S18 acetylase RimI-like enzyme